MKPRPTTGAQRDKTRILLVDDHPLLVEGLTARIEHEPDLAVVGSAPDAVHALEAIRSLRPDLVVADVSLPGRDGIELVKEIRSHFPQLLVLVLSLHDESLYAERALRAGAQGYIMKSAPPDEFIRAVRVVLKGQLSVGASVMNRLLRTMSHTKERAPALELLTDRELEVLRLFGEGHDRSRIAAELNLSVKTIEAHRSSIRQKLGLKDSVELLRYAMDYVREEGT